MRKTHILTAAALLAASSGIAQAQPTDRGPPPDPFGDATISRADAGAKAAAQFDSLDTDHDGFISPDEMQAMMPPGMARGGGMGGGGMGRMMMRADTNGDGKLSKDEFTAGALRRFDMADANHDGQLTKAERDALRNAMRGRMHDHMGGPEGGMGGPQGGSGDMPPPPPDDGQ